ncbi:hypothetical protein HG263_07345 [Pseudoalteromonas sp. JBTF-M23]|uniref:Uncharacterized protein n=1 Tax=Pseudoalteromonas caenipelagi TaxID=2726988 RepID=A0A849VAP9_9GAMM|nr:hypothetical protein [Pseudoalteromonas caenipelagi]NOU50356.1 hypothetical protein [Pseudoalteromonas caenipelagi]
MTSKTFGLSSPVYEFQRVLSYTLGQSSNVIVSELYNENEIDVVALSSNTAKAIAQVIKLEQNIGNLNIKIWVKDIKGETYEPNQTDFNTELLIENAREALINNPIIQSVTAIDDLSGNEIAGVSVVPTTIQFWNDNIANPSSFTTLLASDGFERVLNDQFKVFNQGKEIGNL